MPETEVQIGNPDLRSRQSPARYAVFFSIFLAWVLTIFFVTSRSKIHLGWHTGKDGMRTGTSRFGLRAIPLRIPQLIIFPSGYHLLVGIISKLFFAPFLGTAIVLNLAAFFTTATLISDWFSRRFGISPYLLFRFILSAPPPLTLFLLRTRTSFSCSCCGFCSKGSTLSPSRLRGHGNLIAQSLILLVLPWIRLTGYALASWLLNDKLAALAVFVSLALWLGFQSDDRGQPILFSACAGVICNAGREFLPRPVRQFGAAVLQNDLHNGFVTPWLQLALLPLFLSLCFHGRRNLAGKKGEGLLAITVFSILFLSHNQGVWRSVVGSDLPLFPVLCLPLLVARGSRATSLVLQGGILSSDRRSIRFAILFCRHVSFRGLGLFRENPWCVEVRPASEMGTPITAPFRQPVPIRARGDGVAICGNCANRLSH